jgi:hypothetical protein
VILKKGIKLLGIRPELMMGLNVAASVYLEVGEVLVVTSVTDGKHKKSSLHHAGQAADLRTRYFDNATIVQVAEMLRGRLTNEFNVVVESDHIHLEYQP